MSVKYIPGTKRDIWKYRTARAAKERQRKDISETSYVALRRVYLQKKKEYPTLEQIGDKFNSFVKEQKHKQVIDIFNYYIADIS